MENLELKNNRSSELAKVPIVRKGSIHDEIVDAKTKEVIWTHDEENLITIGCSHLIAALFYGDTTYGKLQHFAVGTGQGDFWDDLTAEERQDKAYYEMTQLYNETYRRALAIQYVDVNGDPSVSITRWLEITASFGTDVSGYLREFGIFGGNATSVLGSGFMIDYHPHSVISFNIGVASMILNRRLKLTL